MTTSKIPLFFSQHPPGYPPAEDCSERFERWHLAPSPAHHCSSSQVSKVSTRSWPQHTREAELAQRSPCLALSFLIYHMSNISSFTFHLESSFWLLLQLALGLYPQCLMLNLAVHLLSCFLPHWPPKVRQSLKKQSLAKPQSETHQEIIH